MMRIKNWARFQHFRNRRPPWIKLYRDILEDPEWHDLPDDAAKALVGLWLLASENCGNLPDVRRIAFRLRLTVDKTALLVEKLAHWLEADKPERVSPEGPHDITPISKRYRDDAPEREGETEKETEKRESAHATGCWDGESFKSWVLELSAIPGVTVHQAEAERVWMQMQPHKSSPAWPAIRSAWNDFVLACIEKPFERPLKSWTGYMRTALQRPKTGAKGKTEPDYSKKF